MSAKDRLPFLLCPMLERWVAEMGLFYGLLGSLTHFSSEEVCVMAGSVVTA